MAHPIPSHHAREATLLTALRQQDERAIRSVIQQHNQRLFRIARSVMRDDAEAEDVVQDAYIKAFQKIDQFRGEAGLGAWLSRIVLNEALMRLRKRKAAPVSTPLDETREPAGQIIPFPLASNQPDPERVMAQNQIQRILERKIDELPEDFRIVLVARTIEEMSIEETAELLDLKPETVKTRLHRARALLQEKLEEEIGPALLTVFPFAGQRCRTMADKVLRKMKTAT